jgi:hypothetical protein
MPTAGPEPDAVETVTSEPDGYTGAQPEVEAAPSKATVQSETEPMVQPEPEPVVVPLPTSGPSLPPSPTEPLYALVRACGKPAQRLVTTRRGRGQLWQVFSDRAGVILNRAPQRVTFFDPSEVQVVTLCGRLPDAA